MPAMPHALSKSQELWDRSLSAVPKAEDAFSLQLMESASILFEKAVPVRVSKSGCEDRVEELTTRIMLGVSKHNRNSKVLRIQVTSDLDPFFLHTLEVNEEDFQTLKVEQCILVDFATFPYKLIELLEQCFEARAQEAPRFLAVLQCRAGDSSLSIVETNQFKHLSHIALCFRPGNDAAIKHYLAGRLAEFKAANVDLHGKLERTLHALESTQKERTSISSEASELRESNARLLSEMRAEQAMALTLEKEKAMQEVGLLKQKLEQERLEMEGRYRQQIDKLQERNTELDKQARSLLDTKYALEARLGELKTKLATAEESLQETQKECERLRGENRSLDTEKHEANKALNRHLIRLSALEQQARDKEELLANLTQQLEGTQSHRAAVEAAFKDSQGALARAEERVAASSAEINKGNQIIEKLQLELRSVRGKLKVKKEVTAQQESLLSERQALLDKAQRETTAVRQEMAGLRADNDALKAKVEDLKAKLEEGQELLKSNQQMIQWLNGQVTEAQLGKYSSAAAAPSTSTRFTFRPSVSFAPPTPPPQVPPPLSTSAPTSIPPRTAGASNLTYKPSTSYSELPARLGAVSTPSPYLATPGRAGLGASTGASGTVKFRPPGGLQGKGGLGEQGQQTTVSEWQKWRPQAHDAARGGGLSSGANEGQGYGAGKLGTTSLTAVPAR